MEFKVAVEQNLDNVKRYLVSQGCQVDTFSAAEVENIGAVSHYNAIIVSGSNDNLMGYEDVITTAPIISAEGMTPEEIFNRLNTHNNFQ